MSTSDETFQEFLPKFRVLRVHILEYSCKELEQPGRVISGMGFNIKVETAVDNDLRFIIVTPMISAFVVDSPETELMSLKIQVVFESPGLEEYMSDKVLTLPDLFWATLIGFSIGMARGILYEKSVGLSFGHTVTPPIDTLAFIPKPINLGDPSKQTEITLMLPPDPPPPDAKN